jgi:hypothetical protein
MPEPRGYALSPEVADDLEDVIEIVKGDYRNPAPQTPKRARRAVRNCQIIRVTGAATTVNGIKYYPGRTQTWDYAGGEFDDLLASDDVKIFQIDNVDLETDGTGIYDSIQLDYQSFSGTSYPVFCTEQIQSATCEFGSDPEGTTCEDELCSVDFVEVRCNSGTTEYRRVRLYFPFQVKQCVGEWTTTNPPDDF